MTVAEITRFEESTQIWCSCTEDSFNLEVQALHRWNLSTFNDEHFIHKLSCAILNGFDAIQS